VNDQAVKPWGSLSWPNRISLLRLLLVAPFVVLLLNQNRPEWYLARHGAILIFIAMAFSDVIDGLLARRLDARTRLGTLLDPMADKALVTASVIVLSLEASAVKGARLPNWVVVAVVGKDLWVVIGSLVVYLVTDRLKITPTRSGKLSTFAQLLMVGFALIAPDINWMLSAYVEGLEDRPVGTWIVQGLSYAVAGLCVLALISYTRLGLRFIVAEQKPLDEGGGSETHGSD